MRSTGMAATRCCLGGAEGSGGGGSDALLGSGHGSDVYTLNSCLDLWTNPDLGLKKRAAILTEWMAVDAIVDDNENDALDGSDGGNWLIYSESDWGDLQVWLGD